MADMKSARERTEASAQRVFDSTIAYLEQMGIVKKVPKELLQEEYENMMANPQLITAKVQELAQSMPPERAQLTVARQLKRFQKEQD